jgi:predicted DNA-binding antitoxin AbrB/MazE fold protein
MTKEIEAVYEQGMIRPLQPLELPEGHGAISLLLLTNNLVPMGIQPKSLRKLQLYL